MERTNTAILWDFDWSMIDENSDPYIVEFFGDKEMKSLFDKDFKSGLPWIQVMNNAMKRLHEKGISKNRMEEAFSKIPFRSGSLKSLELCTSLGCEMFIISHANTFFIDTILRAYNAKTHFPDTKIFTQPAHFNEEGMLVIGEFPHKVHNLNPCKRCTGAPMVCKGAVVDSLHSKHNFERKIYIGDSTGDFCACLQLGSNDHILARKSASLEKALLGSKDIKAKIHSWANYDEMLLLFENILKNKLN